MEEMRLQKYLALSGIASRRKAEELIKEGKVSVNGTVVTEMGVKVGGKDKVKVEGKNIKLEEKKVYIALNKPVGCITTVKDQFDRNTVMDYIKDINERLYPVGRLDSYTSGLLILTNDGEFTNMMTHPKHEVEKVYKALIEGQPTEEELDKLRTGVEIEGFVTSPAIVEVVEKSLKNCTIQITIHEGKNRQIRKMCEKIGHPVIRLKRISIGHLTLEGIKEGQWRHLTPEEVSEFKKHKKTPPHK